MLVKAQFAQELGFDSVDYQFLFLISNEDLAILGQDSIREYDKKWQNIKISRNLTEDVYDETMDLHRRGFVARCPFRPDAFEGCEPYPGQIHRLRHGETYWVLLDGPWQTDITYDNRVNRQRLVHSVYNINGIYPYVRDYQGVFEAVEEVYSLPNNAYRQFPNSGFLSHIEQNISSSSEGFSKTLDNSNFDFYMRVWGAVAAFWLSENYRNEGLKLFRASNSTPRIQSLYRLYAKTVRNYHSKDHHEASPLGPSIRELSNPSEFGAYGALLPFAMIENPYAFVGPCSNPGVSSGSSGNATTQLFPFFVMDILAQALYSAGAKNQNRSLSVLNEAFRHLELRNHQAFSKYGESGNNIADAFNFDKDGLVPSGSTIFSRSVIQNAVVRRSKELELVRKNVLKKVYIADHVVDNPYQSLAGWAGSRLEPVPVNDVLNSGTLNLLTSKLTHIDPTENKCTWRGLRSRLDTVAQIADLIRSYANDVGSENPLPVNPPITKANTNSEQLVLTSSQAQATRNVIRKRLSCVQGDPGTGKSYWMHELARITRELTSQGDMTVLLILTPTNAAATRLCNLFSNHSVFVFGGDSGDANQNENQDEEFSFRIGIGTYDSFLGKIKTSANLRSYLRDVQVILATDETGQVTSEKLCEVLQFFREPGSNNLSDKLIRIVATGDPYQLQSVEPGSLFANMLRFCPVASLTEQQRYNSETQTGISLNEIFSGIRRGMTSEASRIEVVEKLVQIAQEPQLGEGHIRVHVLDDIPTTRPESASYEKSWKKFLYNLEEQARNIVFREVLGWSKKSLASKSDSPRIPLNPKPEEKRQALHDYNTFREAVTEPELPFQIITLVEKMRSMSGKTEYLSSSERVNGWFHDALLGRLPQTIGYKSAELPINMKPIVKTIGHSKVWIDGKHTEIDAHIEKLRKDRQAHYDFLSHNRPWNLTLYPQAPYVVVTGEFKSQGIYVGDVVRYKGIVQKRSRNTYIFDSVETGRELQISARYCTRHSLEYGWATNVHQTQGREYPLVIILWFDGVCFPFITSQWEHLVTRKREDICKPIEQLKFGGIKLGSELASLDDKLDTRALYTGTTRTSMIEAGTEYLHLAAPNRSKIGRCVIVAGKHALRRYLSLHVHERKTPLFGMIWDQMQGTK